MRDCVCAGMVLVFGLMIRCGGEAFVRGCGRVLGFSREIFIGVFLGLLVIN